MNIHRVWWHGYDSKQQNGDGFGNDGTLHNFCRTSSCRYIIWLYTDKVVMIKITRIIYGFRWQWNSTSPVRSVIKALDFIVLSWRRVTGEDIKGIWVTVVSAGALPVHFTKQDRHRENYGVLLWLYGECLRHFTAICSDMSRYISLAQRYVARHIATYRSLSLATRSAAEP